jgi:hypothetical protein
MASISKVLRSVSDSGLMFQCPGCGSLHVIPVGDGKPPRWSWNGDADRPTFQPSILVKWPFGDPPVWNVCHSFVTGGQIQFLGDCTHALAGKTVSLPEWTEED